MNKSELIDAIAAETELSKVASGKALDAVIKTIVQAVKTAAAEAKASEAPAATSQDTSSTAGKDTTVVAQAEPKH